MIGRAKALVLGAAAAAGVAVWLAGREEEHLLRDIDGGVHGSLEHPEGRWPVLFFLTPDCPIANRYAPEIHRICESYASRGVQCLLVYADPALTADAVRRHARDFYASRYPAILDSDRRLVEKAGATVSSEVAVFSRGAELKYRGRIDNRDAELGVSRQVVTQHDLRDALDALSTGRPVPRARTEAVGCYLPEQIGEKP